MNWKYCEERAGHRYYWKASGLINEYRVELFVEDDWDYGPQWKVESGQYGTYFSPSNGRHLASLEIAREEAEALFYQMKKQYEGKDEDYGGNCYEAFIYGWGK